MLVGVDDSGQAVGLAASDPKNIRARDGFDAFLRHFDATILHPTSGWSSAKSGKIIVEKPIPHDLFELHRATSGGTEILTVLVRALPAGDTCVNCIEGPPNKERVFVPVRKLGVFGEVTDLVRPSDIADWQRRRIPEHIRYGELLKRFTLTAPSSSVPAPLGIEDRIASYHAGLKRLLEEVDRCFIALDAEERTDLAISESSMQPWAEEYLADDLGWDSNDEDVEDETEGQDTESRSTSDVPTEVAEVGRSGGVFNLLDQEPRAVLLGEPGGGKTTCLKALALRSLAKYSAGASVAVVVPLSRYANPSDLTSLITRATSFGASVKTPLSAADINYLLATKRLVLLFDALNECPESLRFGCVREIKSLLQNHPSVRATISSRIVGWRSELQLPAFTIRPLDNARQLALLTNFLANETQAKDLHKQLLALPSGSNTASNPLILRMAIQIFRADGILPDGRALLYRRFVGLWFAREENKSRLADDPLPWNEASTRRALARLAFSARLERRRVLPRDLAERSLREDISSPALFLDRLGQGFLIRATATEVDFAHETFQEYLAAEHCLENPDAIVQATTSQYPQWGMALAYAAELGGASLPPKLLHTAWRLNPWLGAVLTPTGMPLPSDLDSLIAGWDPDAQNCLRIVCLALPATEARIGVGLGWYTKQDAALAYVIAKEPSTRGSWMALETYLLRTAWHPAVALQFFNRAVTDKELLMDAAWPAKKGTPRPWRVPKSWIVKSSASIALQLINIGVLRAQDFLPHKSRLIESATPRKARHWISAGVFSTADFSSRRQEWIDTDQLQFASDLVKAGICIFDDFPSRKDGLIDKASIGEACIAVQLGVLALGDFATKIPSWVSNATPKEARRMVRVGLCAPEDFASRKDRIIRTRKASHAWCWVSAGVCVPEDFAVQKQEWIATASLKEAQRLISAGICSSEDFAHRQQAWSTQGEVKTKSGSILSGDDKDLPPPIDPTPGSTHPISEEPPYSPPYRSEQLSDETTRLALSRQLGGTILQATVKLCRDRYCFLSHPDFPENLFCFIRSESSGTAPFTPGDRVTCEVAIRLNRKKCTWSFNAVNLKRPD